MSCEAYNIIMKRITRSLNMLVTFFRNHEPNRIPEMSLSYLPNMQIYYPSKKDKLSNRFFSEYSCTICVHYFMPLTKVCLIWYMIQTTCKSFFRALNLAIL